MNKFNKLLGAYLQDLGLEISDSSDSLPKELVAKILRFIEEVEDCKNKEEKKDPIKEEMSPEECLACELMNMLGLKDDALSMPGEHISATKPTIKIRIKKVSSKEDLDKVLKELKNGGNLDLNTMNDSLGDIFDLNSIQEIMETPMFKQGGSMNGRPSLIYDGQGNKVDPKILELKIQENLKKYPGLSKEQAAGSAPIIKDGKKYYLNGDGKLIPAKEQGGLINNNEITLEDFLNEN